MSNKKQQDKNELSQLASRILQAMGSRHQVGWSVAEGRIVHDMKQHDPGVVQLYRFPHEVDAALRELEKAKYIEKHPIFPDWEIRKLSQKG